MAKKTRQQARQDGGTGSEGGGTTGEDGGGHGVRDGVTAGTERRTRRANVDTAAARGLEGGVNGVGRGGGERPAGRVTRQRARAKADNAVEANLDVVEEEVIDDDDDEPDIGKTLHAKDGKLGFVTNRGFVAATNFLVDIQAQVFSETYSIKGTTDVY